MSNKKHTDARLKDFKGPFFPTSLDRIQKRYRYHAERFNDMLFDDVADRLKGKVKHHPLTSDEKNWHKSPWSHGVSFTRHGNKYKVLFPTAMDSKRIDGTFASRHVAVYCDSEVPPEILEREVQEFVQAFDDVYRWMYRNAIKNSKLLE